MFMHGDALHLLFNMLWVYFLGSAIERLQGSLFVALLILGTHFVGINFQVALSMVEALPETIRGTPFAIGASGAVYGLFGYLWIRPAIDPAYPIRLVPMNVALMLGWLVLCLTPIVQGIANGAHLGGLIAGMLAAMIGRLGRS
jgi:GlpG protein